MREVGPSTACKLCAYSHSFISTIHQPSELDVRARTDMATAKEKKLAQMKRNALRTWEPEYCPESIVPPSESVNTITRRSTRVSLPLILADQITM